MQERRCIPRWQVNKKAGLTFENGVKPMLCVVEDINACGMRVSLSKELFPEAFSNFNLDLDNGCAFDASARVAWSESAYERNIYGLSFNRIDEPAKNRIARYIQDNFPAEMIKRAWRGV
ncbi:MAG: PilZ domain-containing protein [Candidatus Omnitrophota bacterium]